jgi:hypothetical protein
VFEEKELLKNLKSSRHFKVSVFTNLLRSLFGTNVEKGSEPSVAGKMATVTFQDLLISSKFFYTEDDDSKIDLPDETKEIVSVKHDQRSYVGHDQTETWHSETTPTNQCSYLDIDHALETACGDAEFLV